jgi:hypothetical protein
LRSGLLSCIARVRARAGLEDHLVSDLSDRRDRHHRDRHRRRDRRT